MTAPFEAFLVFSTNLNPADLGDEAFLRRIQYKMLMRGPSQNEFVRIFENFCAAKKLPFRPEVITSFLERCYRQNGREFRRCHPRDLLTHALDLIHFERLPMELTDEVLDRAFQGCFVQADDSEPAAESAIVHAVTTAVRRLPDRPRRQYPDRIRRTRLPGLVSRSRHRRIPRSRGRPRVRPSGNADHRVINIAG